MGDRYRFRVWREDAISPKRSETTLFNLILTRTEM